jgi:hypothetical protein
MADRLPSRPGYTPRPPALPGYAPQNINPDKSQTIDESVAGLRAELDSLKQFIGVKYTLSNPSSNYASPLDAFYTRAGSLPSYLMSIGVFSIGPNGTAVQDGFIWTSASPGATQIAWSAGIVTYNGVQYAVAAGNSDVNSFFVYWQKSNPNVFQSNTTFPLSLGSDDFIISVGTSGLYKPAINLVRGDGTARGIYYGEGLFELNSSGNVVCNFGGGTTGVMEVADSGGINRIQIQGQAPATTANAGGITPPATVAGYLIVQIGGTITGGGGTTRKIPFYAT